MKKISGSTFYVRKIFPTIWFGFLGIFMLFAITSEDLVKLFFLPLIIPLIMAVFGYFLMKNLVWHLADEVYDRGDSLLIRKSGKEQIVYLKDIINISHSKFSSPEQIVINTREEGSIGKEIAFRPLSKLWPFSKNKLADDLIDRIDKIKNT